MQIITVEDTRFDVYRKGVDFIQKYIFPGGMLPSPSVLRKEVEKAGLKRATIHRIRRKLQPDTPALARYIQRAMGRRIVAWIRRSVQKNVEFLSNILRGGFSCRMYRRDTDNGH